MTDKNNRNEVIALVKCWLEKTVIGLNLCPFAKHPFINEQIRIEAVLSSDLEVVYRTLIEELEYLSNCQREDVETSLIVCPNVLSNFDQYLDFLEIANDTLNERKLEGVFQLASFHPDYLFENTLPSDQSNCTNRSPFPIFHIIREDSLTKINENPESVQKIPERNIELMRGMSREDLKRHFPWLSSF